MKLTRKAIVLVLLVIAFMAFSQKPARADYQCELNAALNYAACLDACDNYYPWWTGCSFHCQSNYEAELANCNP